MTMRIAWMTLALILATTAAAVSWQTGPRDSVAGSVLNRPAIPDSALSLDVARRLWRAGQVDDALVVLTRLGDRADGEALDLMHLACLTEVGRYDDARVLIEERVSAGPSPAFAARAAEFLLTLGAVDEAAMVIEATDSTAPSIELVTALLEFERGDRAGAQRRLAAIPVPSPTGATTPPDLLVVAGRAAWLRGEFQSAKELFQAASRRDPELVEARLLVAALFKEKYESKVARAQLAPVLKTNPRHPEANLLLAEIDFADGRYRTVEGRCHQTLQVNPLHTRALELLATIHLVDGEMHAASSAIEEALLVNPVSKPLHALRAAMLVQIGDSEAAEAEAQALLDRDPLYADVFWIMGGAMDRQRRYREAAALYKRALAVDPEHALSANSLGLLYMRDGREEEAKQWLDRGFELDRYNIRTFNMRRLLETIASYERYETEDFIIKVSKEDRGLLPLLAHDLQEIHEKQCALFGYEPDRKTTVEVFHQRELMSARLVGLPGVHGIPAACFGSVIAMEAPRLWSGDNWSTVLAHEFGHVLALTRTEKRVPHWFTEGLSVVLEERETPAPWDQLARWRFERGAGLPFVALNHGFTRSRDMAERNLAYYKSGFAVRHLIDNHGWPMAMQFLDDFARGLTTSEIIRGRLGISVDPFGSMIDSLFSARVEQAPVWPPSEQEDLVESIRAADSDPGDLDARASMALEWLRAGELETAVSEALAVVEQDAGHPEANFVLGHALLGQGEAYAALGYLEPLLDDAALLEELPIGFLVVRDLGMAYADLGESEAAIPLLEKAISSYPSDREPFLKLAAAHELSGRLEEAVAVLEDLTRRHPTEHDAMLEMAALAEGAGKPDVAALALERALRVKPDRVPTVERLAELYEGLGRPAARARALETLCLLVPSRVEAYEALVALCLEHGPVGTARRYAPRLLELDPGSAVARRALETP